MLVQNGALAVRHGLLRTGPIYTERNVMTNEQKLLALGAECVGGDLILHHKVLGRFRNGDLHLTDDGKAVLESAQSPDEAKSRRGRPPKVADDEEV